MNSTKSDTGSHVRRKVRFGLTSKLFLLVLVSFGLLMLFIIYNVGVQAEDAANTSIEKSFSELDQIVETRLDSRYKSIEETAGNLARDGRLLPLIYAEESSSLQDQCSEFEKSLNFDVLIFTNDVGEILARSDQPEDIGIFVDRRQLFQSALAGERDMGIMKRGDELLQLVVVPVFDNAAPDIVRGAIGLAYRLSDSLASEIKSLTGSDIAFYSFQPEQNGTVVKPPTEICTTIRDNSGRLQQYFHTNPTMWQRLSRDNAVIEGDIVLGEETFRTLLRPLTTRSGSPIGYVAGLRSRTELLRPFENIKRRVLMVVMIGLVVTSIISYGIARHISKPIIGLVSVAKSIQDGHYPDPTPVNRGDEVGVLYEAMYEMGQELKEKAELENYLAEISEDIDDFAVAADAPTDIDTDVAATDYPEDERTMVEDAPQTQRSGEFKPGKLVADRYRIHTVLGQGAAGLVYLANDTDLNEAVALKFITRSEISGAVLEQFKQEIRLARRITHKNVLRTHDFGTYDGAHYISMEYVNGKDLSHLIKKKGTLDIRLGVRFARQMCSAISAAHEEGVIHRDLKPQNMMISNRGILKIMDFGIAINIEQKADDASEPSGAYGKSALVGTPNFMSPEQFDEKEVDVRTDIYSLGVILFYMFSGQLPFTAKSLWELAQKHRQQPPPALLSLRPDAPPALEALINKALAKDRGERFQTVHELATELSRV